MSKPHYTFEIATSPAHLQAHFDLRRQIFCEEQGLFEDSDRDEYDTQGYPIVALYHQPDMTPRVVGVVRIYELEPRLWYGGRLGTHPDFRRGWRIGKGLIHKAVTTANTWGCDQFLATVQEQNVRFFQRLHWDSLETLEIRGIHHHRMEADLAYYPAVEQSQIQRQVQPQSLSAVA